MKKSLLILFLVFACVFNFACSNDIPDVQKPDPLNTTAPYESDTTNDTTDDQSTDRFGTMESTDSNVPDGESDQPLGHCNVHRGEYHSVPADIHDWVIGQGKEFYDWVSDAKKRSEDIDSDCVESCINIYDLVEYFDIPKEVWIEYYNKCSMMTYRNIDLLYDGSAEDNDRYYRLTSLDEEDFSEYQRWNNFRNIKSAAMRMSKAEGKSMQWSLVQLMSTTRSSHWSEILPDQDFPGSSTEFIYNPDALSVLPEEDIDEIVQKYTPFYLDCLVCGVTPYNTPYERQAALNAVVKQPVCSQDHCMVHRQEYHTFPVEVTDWISGQGKNFRTWIVDAEKRSADVDSDCPYTCANIYECVKYFDVPKEAWIEYYNKLSMTRYLNIDLLYDGSAEDNDRYYRLTSLDNDDFSEYQKWVNFREIKSAVRQMSKAEGKSTYWSLVQLMSTIRSSHWSEILPDQDFTESSTEFIYNPDALSVLPEKDIDEIIEKYTPFYLDCLACGVTPYNTPYERQAALNAAKE